MLITCPQCETTFALPDELFKPGKKARCSQCGNVFVMTIPPDPSPEGQTVSGSSSSVGQASTKQQTPSGSFFSRQKKKLLMAAAGMLIVILAYGGWLVASSFFGTAEGPGELTPSAEELARAEHEQRINSISLEDIRQFLVDNGQFGRGMVIQGVAVNISDTNKDYITIEARILDDRNRILAQVQQLCGVSMTLFQLQTLSAEEIKETLNNRITILTNNTNIPSGGKVPFVVVFPEPPAKMKAFEVRVIDVRESPTM